MSEGSCRTVMTGLVSVLLLLRQVTCLLPAALAVTAYCPSYLLPLTSYLLSQLTAPLTCYSNNFTLIPILDLCFPLQMSLYQIAWTKHPPKAPFLFFGGPAYLCEERLCLKSSSYTSSLRP